MLQIAYLDLLIDRPRTKVHLNKQQAFLPHLFLTRGERKIRNFHETFICLRQSPGSCRKRVEFLLFMGVPLSLILSKSFAFFGVEKKLGLNTTGLKSPNDFRVANLERGNSLTRIFESWTKQSKSDEATFSINNQTKQGTFCSTKKIRFYLSFYFTVESTRKISLQHPEFCGHRDLKNLSNRGEIPLLRRRNMLAADAILYFAVGNKIKASFDRFESPKPLLHVCVKNLARESNLPFQPENSFFERITLS